MFLHFYLFIGEENGILHFSNWFTEENSSKNFNLQVLLTTQQNQKHEMIQIMQLILIRVNIM